MKKKNKKKNYPTWRSEKSSTTLFHETCFLEERSGSMVITAVFERIDAVAAAGLGSKQDSGS